MATLTANTNPDFNRDDPRIRHAVDVTQTKAWKDILKQANLSRYRIGNLFLGDAGNEYRDLPKHERTSERLAAIKVAHARYQIHEALLKQRGVEDQNLLEIDVQTDKDHPNRVKEWVKPRELFSGGGVSEANVQSALSITLKRRGDVQKVLSGTPKTGREAVLEVFQMEFEKSEHLSPDAARMAARKLYAENRIGRHEVQTIQDTVRRQEVTGEQRGWMAESLRPIDRAKEVLFGREEAFVCNLAESPAVEVPKGAGNGRFLRGTHRLGMWRKSGARPAWGGLKFPQLIVAFCGLRVSIKQKHVGNTPYIRTQMEELSRLMARDIAHSHVHGLDVTEATEEQKKSLVATDEGEKFQEQLRLAMTGEIPPMYASDVSAAVSYASSKTGRVRKTVGRSIKKTVTVPFKYLVKEPTKFVAKNMIAAPIRNGWNKLKQFWHWGWTLPGSGNAH